MKEPNQTPTLAERLRAKVPYPIAAEAADELDRLTAALAASEAEKETYRARWLSCVTPEEAERLRAALSAAERERDEWRRKAEYEASEYDRLTRAMNEAERERDSLRERLAQAAKWFREYEAHHDAKGDYLKALRNAERARACEDAARKRTEEVTEES